jgi:hypothetical protein
MTSKRNPNGTLVGRAIVSDDIGDIKRFFGQCDEKFVRSYGLDEGEYLVDAAATAIADAIEALDVETISH